MYAAAVVHVKLGHVQAPDLSGPLLYLVTLPVGDVYQLGRAGPVGGTVVSAVGDSGCSDGCGGLTGHVPYR